MESNTDTEDQPVYRPCASPVYAPKGDGTRKYRRRWAILSIFCSLSMSNAFQWIEYAIITNIITKYYSVDILAVNWTSMIYMLAYIPLVFPATWFLDKYGLRLTALLGSCGNCLGAWIKCASASPDRFWVTFLGQTIVGTSQIFILGLPPRLAAIWFGPTEVSTACSLGVFGNQLGIAIGFLLPPMIVQNYESPSSSSIVNGSSNGTNVTAVNQTDVIPQEFFDGVTSDLQVLFFGSAIVNTIVFILVIAFFRDKPRHPPSLAQLSSIENSIEKNYMNSLKQLVFNRNYILLVVTYGINTGAFYAVSTLLNQVLIEIYPGEEVNIGRIGLVIILAGMMGSLVCGFWLDRTKLFKPTIVAVYLLSFVGMALYTFFVDIQTHLWVLFFIAAFLGFFMTGYLPLGFEFAIELTHPISEGTSSGLLNASAQVFGIVMTLIMGELDTHVSERACNISLTLCLAAGTLITMLMKADMRRQEAEKKSSSKLTALDNGQAEASEEFSRFVTKPEKSAVVSSSAQ